MAMNILGRWQMRNMVTVQTRTSAMLASLDCAAETRRRWAAARARCRREPPTRRESEIGKVFYYYITEKSFLNAKTTRFDFCMHSEINGKTETPQFVHLLEC